MDSNYNDDYYGNDENLYSSALNQNTKNDPGAISIPKKLRKIPIWKIDENSEIPEMPQVVVEMPNDPHYNKLLKEQDDLIAKHQKSINDIKAKIEIERYGNNPERTKLLDDRKKLGDILKPFTDELYTLNEKLYPVKDDMTYYRNEKDLLQREIDFKDMNKLNAEIRRIQEKIGFSSMTMTEEKRTIALKAKLEGQRPKVEKYKELSDALDKLYKDNDESLKRQKVKLPITKFRN